MRKLFKIKKSKIRLLTSVVQRGPTTIKNSPQLELFILFSAADLDFEITETHLLQVNNIIHVFRIFPFP